MIEYDYGRWHILFVFQCRGSVLPRGMGIGLASLVLTALIWVSLNGFVLSVDEAFQNKKASDFSHTAFGAISSAVAFTLTYRTSNALGRFFEGAQLFAQIRGQWLNATSSCISFCTQKPEKATEVQAFQNLLARLVSLMFGLTVARLTGTESVQFEILDCNALDEQSFSFLAKDEDKVEVVLNWIQRLLVESMDRGIMSVPPPIASRVFQEFGQGFVNLKKAENLTFTPLPFCFSQVSQCMVLGIVATHTIFQPFRATQLFHLLILNFTLATCFASLGYVAAEMEKPFGPDPNDLPVLDMQTCVNTRLIQLLHPVAQSIPRLDMTQLRGGTQRISFGRDGTLSTEAGDRTVKVCNPKVEADSSQSSADPNELGHAHETQHAVVSARDDSSGAGAVGQRSKSQKYPEVACSECLPCEGDWVACRRCTLVCADDQRGVNDGWNLNPGSLAQIVHVRSDDASGIRFQLRNSENVVSTWLSPASFVYRAPLTPTTHRRRDQSNGADTSCAETVI